MNCFSTCHAWVIRLDWVIGSPLVGDSPDPFRLMQSFTHRLTTMCVPSISTCKMLVVINHLLGGYFSWLEWFEMTSICCQFVLHFAMKWFRRFCFFFTNYWWLSSCVSHTSIYIQLSKEGFCVNLLSVCLVSGIVCLCQNIIDHAAISPRCYWEV